jgi:hypothetical protein
MGSHDNVLRRLSRPVAPSSGVLDWRIRKVLDKMKAQNLTVWGEWTLAQWRARYRGVCSSIARARRAHQEEMRTLAVIDLT